MVDADQGGAVHRIAYSQAFSQLQLLVRQGIDKVFGANSFRNGKRNQGQTGSGLVAFAELLGKPENPGINMNLS